MDYIDVCKEIRTKIIDQLNVNSKCGFVIFPFSVNGLIALDLLKNQFAKEPEAIIDDTISKFNPDIKPLSYLSEIDFTNKKVLFVDNNPKVVDSLRYNLYRILPRDKVIDVFETYSNDKRVTWLRGYAENVYKDNIIGSVAECGVNKGDFAEYINLFFYDRKCYLFDSFEGFRLQDIEMDPSSNDSLFFDKRHMNIYKDTSVNRVLDRMKYKDTIVIKKGYIPDTLVDVDDSFVFVHLDMDLYTPMLEALTFFYPRMVDGGVILLHDYYNYRLPGVEKAVECFESKNNIRLKKVPGADLSGVIIIK